MTGLTRAIDKFNGIKLCDMKSEELNEFLGGIAERGAYLGAQNALAHVGLNDENAGTDVKDLRSLLTGYRIVRSTAGRAIWSTLGKILGWIITISFVYLFLRNSEMGQLMIKTMVKD